MLILMPLSARILSTRWVPSFLKHETELYDLMSFGKMVQARQLTERYTVKEIPKYYHSGNRKAQVQHARLVMQLSALNKHLFIKKIL